MAESPEPGDLKVFGLTPDSTTADLRRAYQRARAMWAEDSLATYGLMDQEERAAILARLTETYERLARRLKPGPITRQPPPQKALGDARPAPPPSSASAPEPAPADPENLDPASLLRKQRLARGIDLDTVARETRIRRAILEALEEGDPAPLPAGVYVRGFVIAYAQAVEIDDPEGLATRYLVWIEARRA